ncbi:MAG: hypothetical protein LUC83_04620 [Clostridiales bacterium]|nr:hypothetical protein [Clostridiales bacterium]
MNTRWIVLIVTAAVCVVVFLVFYFLSKRSAKKRDEQQAAIDAAAQTYTMLIIDKKKMRMQGSGIPQQVIDETPRIARRAKVPIVKVKVGPKIMTMIADNDIFDSIPVKKEVKATVAGIYITDVRGIRGPLAKPEKKKRFRDRLKLNEKS